MNTNSAATGSVRWIAWAADFLSQTEDGRTALQGLVADDRALAALLADCVGRAFGREIGAAAVEVTKFLAWDALAGWLGADLLVRRVTDLAGAVTARTMQLSDVELAATAMAAEYVSGNRPSTPWDGLFRPAATPSAADTTEDTENNPHTDGTGQD